MSTFTLVDATQVAAREILQQIYPNATEPELIDLLRSINSDLTAPLRADATNPINRTVTINSSTPSNSISNRQRSISHVNGTIPTFTSGTVVFPAADAGTITVTPGSNLTLSCPAGNYVKILIAIDSSGNLVVTQGTSNAVEASALVPSPTNGTTPFAYVSIHNTAGTVDNVAQNKIFQLTGGGGSGSSLTWNDVTSTSQQMSVGNGYVADNASRVDLTLPATANFGDEIRVVGRGAGGWRIKQNAGQYIIDNTITTATGTIGSLNSGTAESCVHLICTLANTEFTVIDFNGSATAGTTIGGYIAGGSTGARTDTIQTFNFATEATGTLVETLDTPTTRAGTFSSSTKGYCMGGHDNVSRLNSTFALTFATNTGTTIASTLATAISDLNLGNIMSTTKGYTMGGENGAVANTINSLTFSGETAATLAATLDSARNQLGGVCSSTKGYGLGGFNGAVSVNSIDDLTFSGETSVTIAATLGTARYSTSGMSSSTKGYVGGGFGVGNLSSIEALTFSGETMATLAATLDTAKIDMASIYTSTKGYFCGGLPAGVTNVIENLDFSLETSVTIGSTLPTAVSSAFGFQG